MSVGLLEGYARVYIGLTRRGERENVVCKVRVEVESAGRETVHTALYKLEPINIIARERLKQQSPLMDRAFALLLLRDLRPELDPTAQDTVDFSAR